MSIRSIKREEIDFDKIYGTKSDAMNQTNNVKVQEIYWGDNGELTVDFDESTNTGVVSENGVTLGFVSGESIKSIENTANEQTSSPVSQGSMYDGSFRNDSDIMKQQTKIDSISNQEIEEEVVPLESNEDNTSSNEIEEINPSLENTDISEEELNPSEEQSETIVDENDEQSSSQEVVTPISVNLDGYDGSLVAKSNISSEAASTLGVVTDGHQTYQIVDDSSYSGQSGTISQRDYDLLVAQVAGEGANDSDDMFGVACTVINRVESTNFPSDVRGVLEAGYFPWGKTYKAYVPGGKYYDTPEGQAKLAEAKKAVDNVLSGYRNMNSNVYYYSGNHNDHKNHFSDHV